jgi:hypothetical protein
MSSHRRLSISPALARAQKGRYVLAAAGNQVVNFPFEWYERDFSLSFADWLFPFDA